MSRAEEERVCFVCIIPIDGGRRGEEGGGGERGRRMGEGGRRRESGKSLYLTFVHF